MITKTKVSIYLGGKRRYTMAAKLPYKLNYRFSPEHKDYSAKFKKLIKVYLWKK
jgi:hypothetical protein